MGIGSHGHGEFEFGGNVGLLHVVEVKKVGDTDVSRSREWWKGRNAKMPSKERCAYRYKLVSRAENRGLWRRRASFVVSAASKRRFYPQSRWAEAMDTMIGQMSQ